MEDPVAARSEGEDLYDVATWEPRTTLDRLAVRVYRGLLRGGRAVLVLLGIAILVLFLAGGAGALIADNPFVLGLVALSVVPAGVLALYVYAADATTREPLTLVAATFVLAVLFAGFAAIVNTAFDFVRAAGFLGTVVSFYFVVGPGEEVVKLLAVRLFAYRDDRFDAVVDGAVYGAAAGLGFATIENVLFITRELSGLAVPAADAAGGVLGEYLATVEAGGGITAVRSLAGPGHVVYSAFAGYYLGLAKFNRENAGPIVVKGLLVAALIHATYNTLVGIVPGLVALLVGVPSLVAFFGFVVVYQGLFFALLYRKLRRYRRKYEAAHDRAESAGTAASN